MKLEIQKTEQKKMEWEEKSQKISKAIALSSKNFAEEGITKEMAPYAKVSQLAEIMVGLRRKITKLQEQRRPITPQKYMLERRRDAAAQVVKRIEEAEETCAKDVDQVSQTWEALMDDAKSEKLANEMTSILR